MKNFQIIYPLKHIMKSDFEQNELAQKTNPKFFF